VPVPPDEADAYAIRDLMARTLSAEERAVIVLFHLHGFRADEIAEISGKSHDAVRKQLERARAKLALAHAGPDEVGGRVTL
jgi:RNA polymerase sigma factor (sigma-70 family)